MFEDLVERLRQRASPPGRKLLAGLVLITAATVLLWWHGAPFIQPLGLPQGPALAVLLAACAPALLRRALLHADARQHVRALGLLVLLGAACQICLHFITPSGLTQSLDRISHGHGEFLRVAAARRGLLWDTLRNYDALLEAGQLGSFPASKPPGALGFYMLLDQLATSPAVQWCIAPLLALARQTLVAERIPESAALGTLLFPLLTFVSLLPLVWLGRSLHGDSRVGYTAVIIGYSSPALLLVDLHLDGALYPLLALLSLALAAHATHSHKPPFALAGGAVGVLGVYCTFGLLPVLALGLGISTLPALTRLREPVDLRARARPLVFPLAYLLGASLTLFLLIAVLHFRPLVRFENALAFHAHWKRDVPLSSWRWLSLLELSLYLATPLALAVVLDVLAAARSLTRTEHVTASLYSLLVFAMLFTLAMFQGTNEVARLWLFMVPLLALSVAGGLHTRLAPETACRVAIYLCAAQATLTVIMKVQQPW